MSHESNVSNESNLSKESNEDISKIVSKTRNQRRKIENESVRKITEIVGQQ